jgi:diacylglycerol kinase family enzyme
MGEVNLTDMPALPLPARPAQRWIARLAFVTAGAAIALVIVVAGLRGSIGLILVGAAGMALGLAGAWAFLTHRGFLRWSAGVVALLGPAGVAVLYMRARLMWVVVVFALLWLAALALARRALAVTGAPDGPREYEVAPPLRPYLIMNPRSGGGKVDRFDLVERARRLGAEVAVLNGPTDVADLARRAVDAGADLLGVAGGDGTQALVAGIATEHGLPFMVISAGTRNHFALDLGLDREDPGSCLDALTDGVEVHVDLGLVGGRTFVNNASFGAYAAVVQSPAYRDDKVGTTLDLLPDLLAGDRPRLRLTLGDAAVPGAQAVLISNNPYVADDLAGLGRRPRLDAGVLGVLAVTVHTAIEAAALLRGRGRSKSLTLRTAPDAVIDADTPSVPVGIDGEAVTLPTPVHCAIRPGALRVRVPRHRPGIPPPKPELDWARLRQLALSTGRS